MNVRKALVRGSIVATVGVPLALQLAMPGAAYARSFGDGVATVSPSSGPANGGTSVTIIGSGFTGASEVTFGGVAASFTVLSNSEIIATSPAESAGTVLVDVIGSVAMPSKSYFTYS